MRKWGGRGDEPAASTTRGAFTRTVGSSTCPTGRGCRSSTSGGLVDIHHVSGAKTDASVGDAGDVWAADGRLGCVHRLGRKVSVEQAAREPARSAWKCE